MTDGRSMRELTLHHCEAKEVQLFDSKKLYHTIKNILPSGFWLERWRRQYLICTFYTEMINKFDLLDLIDIWQQETY